MTQVNHPAPRDSLSGEARDLMGLLALPAMWANRDAESVLRIMSEAIEHVVPVAFSYADVGLPDGPRLRIAGRPAGDDAQGWWRSVCSWPRTAAPRVRVCDTPAGPMRMVLLSLGLSEAAGGIWFGSAAPGFPSNAQLALLRAATSLAANGMQTARLAAEREQASRAMDEFLAMLGHELRNPLAPIGAAADLLRHGMLDADQIRRTSAIIGRQVVHMTGLVNDLLDVSRVKRGLVTIERTPLDLQRVLDDAVEQVRPLVANRGHELVLELPANGIGISGDHKRLVQVVVNLLSNAAKYTPPGGRITLTATRADREAVVTVADDGIGIEPALLPAVFDLFTQAKRTPDRSQGGLGLGLALVKALVGQHNGSVTAASEGAGRGAVFTVRLPALEEPALPPASAPGLAPPHAGLRVLVVDDNTDAVMMLGMLLESQGHAVCTAHDGARALALALANTGTFDVCVLDIGLPGMDGNALARHLRTLPATAGATLIAVTGYGQPGDREAAQDAGFDHHFVKPVDTQALAVLLADLAEARATMLASARA